MQRILRGGKRKISNVKLLHLRTPFARNRNACRGARWKPENPCGHPEVRSRVCISGFVTTNPETPVFSWFTLQTVKPGDRDLAVQRSEASSRKLTLFAMGICLSPAVSKPSLYKYNASEKMIRCAHFDWRTRCAAR